MAVGLSTVNLANAWLNTMRGGGNGVTFTAPATQFIQLHTGDPGASGTANVSSTTTRMAISLDAAATGSIGDATPPVASWASWAGTNGEVVTHVSCHSASSAGTFYYSAALAASKTVNTGDTLNLNTLTIALTPLAA